MAFVTPLLDHGANRETLSRTNKNLSSTARNHTTVSEIKQTMLSTEQQFKLKFIKKTVQGKSYFSFIGEISSSAGLSSSSGSLVSTVVDAITK
jgi:hypothetical protein